MLDGGESEVTGSAAVCAADCVADLVYYAAEGERLVGVVKTRRLKYPPLAGADDPWGSRQAERCECRAMQKQQRTKAGMKPLGKKGACAQPPHLHKSGGKSAADLPRQTVLNVL